MFAPEIAFVDVETTGASAAYGRITEIAIVRVRADGASWRTDEWSSLVDPGQPIPRAIQVLTGITDAMVAGAPRFEQLADEIAARLDGAVFVAHNASFDYRFIARSFERAGRGFAARSLCTVRLSRMLQPERSPHTLDAIIARHHLKVSERHRALADARALWAFVQALYRSFDAATLHTAAQRLLREPYAL